MQSLDMMDSIELMYETGWTDGLPVVPPTRERVRRFTDYLLPRSPDELIAEVPPLGGMATLEKVAVNAVMAGCLPEHMPVVIAALEALVDDRFNLRGVQCSTGIHTPLVIVNGPIAKDLNINSGYNCFGQGWRANATIGRAVKLVLVNLGGAAFGAPMWMAASIRPGAIDTADFDGDGDPDIAVANRDSNNISIFINDPCAVEPECAEDFECDDDQFCNGAEVCMAGQYQAGQAPNCDDGDLCTNDGCDPVKGCVSTPVACPDGQSCNPGTGMCEATTCLGDLDGDGIIDAFDLALLLGNWGPCK